MLDNGNVVINGHEVSVNADGLSALMGSSFLGFSAIADWSPRWALAMSPKVRADAFNEGFDRIKSALRKNNEEKSFLARVRNGNHGGRVLWSVNGPRYPGRATDADAILQRMIDTMAATPEGRSARGSVVIDPNTSRMTAEVVYWNTTIVTPKVGDVFRAFIRATSRDDGRGAFVGSSGVEAVQCINCTTSESVVEDLRKAHRSAKTLLATVDKTIGSGSRIEPLIARWRKVADVDLSLTIDVDGADRTVSGDDVWAVICNDGDLLAAALKDAGIQRDIATEMLLSAHRSESALGRMDNTLADIPRAVAKAAQDRRLDLFQRAAVEAMSGQMLAILADGTIE
jgi:hypothetical protein